MGRRLGARAGENDIITIYTVKHTSKKAIDNIEDNKLISITMVSALSYECYQFKGKCITYRDSNENDQSKIDSYMKDFNNTLVKIGVKDGLLFKWPTQPSLAIEMKVEEIFEQTPKVGAGSSITKSLS